MHESSSIWQFIADNWKFASPVFLVFGGFIGWALSQLKTKAEITKLKAESNQITTKLPSEVAKTEEEAIEKARGTLEALHKARGEYEKGNKDFGIQIKKLQSKIQNNASAPDIVEARERACNILFNETMPSYLRYVEHKELRLSGSQDKFDDFIEHEVMPQLQDYQKWLAIINHPKMLQINGSAPAKVSDATLRPYRSLGSTLTKIDLKNRLNETILALASS